MGPSMPKYEENLPPIERFKTLCLLYRVGAVGCQPMPVVEIFDANVQSGSTVTGHATYRRGKWTLAL